MRVLVAALLLGVATAAAVPDDYTGQCRIFVFENDLFVIVSCDALLRCNTI